MKARTVAGCIAGFAAVGGLIIAWRGSRKQPKPPSPPSPLLILPPEIRNMIWESALKSARPVCLHCGRYRNRHPWMHGRTGGCDDYLEPALLRTCRQIRRETRSIFYAVNEFRVGIDSESDDRPMQKLHSWLQHIGPEACASLRFIVFDVDNDHWYTPLPYLPKGGEYLALSAWNERSCNLSTSSIIVRAKTRDPVLEQHYRLWAQRILKAGQLARQRRMMRCTMLQLARVAEQKEVTEEDAHWARVLVGAEKADSLIAWTTKALAPWLKPLATVGAVLACVEVILRYQIPYLAPAIYFIGNAILVFLCCFVAVWIIVNLPPVTEA